MNSNPSKLEKLVSQCRSNDVDVKVDALTKLQALFESDLEINDPDSVINVFKSCLRTSNLLLTTATLSALPSLLPLLITRPITAYSNHAASLSKSTSSASLIVDAATLRQSLNAFLPAGGIIERLGDKDKVQAKARDCLVILGGLAFRVAPSSTLTSRSVNGKGPETPLMIFERFLKDSGLSSKVWKVREQSILTLVTIRRSHPTFPMRPYLSLLVDCLEDTDPHVRDCARQSIVELFSGPAVTDAARADLKKEMTKKGVRKTIVDSVLMKLLNNTTPASALVSLEGSENGESSAPKEYIPPSLMLQGRRPRVGSQSTSSRTGEHVRSNSQGSANELSSRPASRSAMVSPPVTSPTSENSEILTVFIASSRDLENEFANMIKPFEGKETEHNWGARDQAITRVRGMLKGGVYQRFSDTFIALLKEGFIQWSLKTLASLRTTVTTNTCSLYCEMASVLGSAMDPFCEVLLANLLKMASLTKKMAAQQSQGTVTAIISHTSSQPRIVIPLLWNTLQEKSAQARITAVSHLKQYLEVHGQRAKTVIESSGNLDVMEKIIKKALGDPNPAVKENARVTFWVFNDIWKDRGTSIGDSLDSMARKQLDSVCPDPELVSLPPTTPKVTKKSSVAAAIAATRAKAKANATAPPIVRQQTSSSLYASTNRSGSPLSLQNSTTRPVSPLKVSETSTSITATKLRVVSAMTPGITRTTSTPIVASNTMQVHTRTSSGGSKRGLSPPSPDYSTYRRRISTPLDRSSSPRRSSTIRRTLQTTLPDSPTHPSTSASPSPRPTSGIIRQAPVPVPSRHSSILPNFMDFEDESLLLAQTVPLPQQGDTDSEEDFVNVMSLSSPCVQMPTVPHVNSPHLSRSPKSDVSKPTATVSNGMSSGSLPDGVPGQPVVEDALRARAEQAESAAERLLELVEPEDEDTPAIPAALLVRGSNGHITKSKDIVTAAVQDCTVLQTPVNRTASILHQAAMFRDSPAYNGKIPSLLDVLQNDHKHQAGWWVKRQALLDRRAFTKIADEDMYGTLQQSITALEGGEPEIATLQQLAFICMANKVADASPPLSPMVDGPVSPSPFNTSQSVPSLHSDIWQKDKTFNRLFRALMQCLNDAKDSEATDYALILLFEMLENQALYLEGKEAELFSILLRVRYCNRHEVLEATNIIRDHLTSKIEAVYGLTTMHAGLRAFHAEAPITDHEETMKATSYAFGLIALGKFILRLPAEIAEEELPRLRQTLITALNDRASLIVRESAAASIIAAQLVLRDETHLFALLDGLTDDKKNLLTYLFDKHGARGMSPTRHSQGSLGMDKLEKEIRRLDTRMSTPLRV